MSQRLLILGAVSPTLQTQRMALPSLEVEVAPTLTVALQRLRTQTYIGALIDIDADTDLGIELCDHLRQDEAFQGIRIAVLSAKPKPEALKRIRPLRTGMDLFLPMPMNTANFQKAIEDWIPIPGEAFLPPPVDRAPGGPVFLEMTMPSPAPAASAAPPLAQSESTKTTKEGLVFPVWFGTNRKPNEAGNGFTSERHDCTTLGQVEVFVPEAHRFGEIGNAFWKRLLRFDLRDDHLRLQNVAPLARDSFYSGMLEELREARTEHAETHALIFLHGFNNTFEDAAIRAAQMGCDLKVPGPTAFFSWPSKGGVKDYAADEASIEASEGAIAEFLVDFLDTCKADKVHIVAHSMGNRGLLRALQRITADAQKTSKVRFDQIILAAPDVDRDVFQDLARNYPPFASRTTLYASAADKAVHLSALIHEHPRAGYFRPYTTVQGIDTVAVPDFDIDLLGHSYFAQAEALLHDIYDLMRHGQRPSERQRLHRIDLEGAEIWELQR